MWKNDKGMVWFWRQAISLRKTIDNCYILSRMRCCLTFYISFCFAPLQRCCLTVFHEQYTHSNALTSIANDSIILSINCSCCQQMSILQVEPRRKRFRGINEQKTQNTNFEHMKKKINFSQSFIHYGGFSFINYGNHQNFVFLRPI